MKYKKGFTLIELLVVVSIIGLLASIVLASLTQAEIKGRDAKRSEDINEIRTAVELYNNDNGHYPNSNGTWTSFDSVTYSPNPIVSPAAANLTAALKPYIGYTSDPKNLGTDSGYLYTGGGSDYCIMFYRTPENMKDFGSSLVNYSGGRCGSINANGQCTGTNSVYVGGGAFLGGC